MTDGAHVELLFSYGTLQRDDVQLATFGRLLNSAPDELPQYRQETFTVTDPEFVRASGKADHAIARFTGNEVDSIAGRVLELTPEELLRSDSYEPVGYTRTAATLKSGKRAWVYAATESIKP